MVPFVKQLSRKVSQQAQNVGYIKTIEGRHSRFPTWEKKEFQPDKSKVALPVSEDKAIKLYGKGNIRRAFTYKALNKLIQGSAADMTKKAMVDLYKNGIVPLIQIHDELNVSIPKDGEEKMKKDIIDIMEGTVKLNVPNRVDCECGDSWGDVESDEED
jgi:DNA polymerase I-like protein with 3'-5' exonuclease and polymerase domains